MKILKILILLFFAFTPVSLVHSASDTFTVSAEVINEDVTPPSAPTGLSGTALSSSQISLSWNASIDDFAVYRYEIYRDGSPVGYSLNTSYTDSGLTASTTYSYYVVAIDFGNNQSAPSDSVPVSTSEGQIIPIIPPTNTGGNSTYGSRKKFLIFEYLNINTSSNSATLTWKNNLESSFVIRYGESPDTENEIISGQDYKFEHSVQINILKSNKTYYFEIEARSKDNQTLIAKDQFNTLVNNKIYLGNVSDLNIFAENKNLVIEWKNPTYIDFAGVKVVKSDIFFPRDIYDGELIYDGSGTNFVDKDIEIGKTYYYTVFAYNKVKTYSSGAIGSGSVIDTNLGQIDLGPFEIENSENIEDVDITGIQLLQNDELLTLNENKQYMFDSSKGILVQIPANILKSEPKLVIVTLVNPADPTKIQSFLSRLNEEKTYFETRIQPIEQEGYNNIIISFIDWKNTKVQSVQLHLLDENYYANSYEKWTTYFLYIINNFWWVILIIFILLGLSLYAYKKRKN